MSSIDKIMKKWLIIDTCIWNYYFKYPEVRDFINEIIGNGKYELCTNEFIKYELEIGFKKESDFKIWSGDIVNKLNNLLIHPQDIEKFFVFYKQKLLNINKIKKESDTRITPSVADAILASQMIRHSNGEFMLLTANNKDFPTQIFDRENTEWADIPGCPIPFCFYNYKK